MRFVLDANMPRSAAGPIRAAGHECTHLRDTPLAAASDRAVAAYVRDNGLVLISRDFGFADIRNYPPEHYAGLVVLAVPDTVSAASLAGLIESLVARRDCLAALPGRLAIVEFGRVRLRPKPAEGGA